MKRHLFLSLLMLAMGLSAAMAQIEDPPIASAALPSTQESAAENPYLPPPAFLDVVLSNGAINFLIWLGIFFWALAVMPFGILSIVRSYRNPNENLSLASKLLVIGALCVLFLGFLGFSRGMTATFFTGAIQESLSSSWRELSLSLCHGLYSLSASLLVCHLHLIFLLATTVILHVRHKRLESIDPRADSL